MFGPAEHVPVGDPVLALPTIAAPQKVLGAAETTVRGRVSGDVEIVAVLGSERVSISASPTGFVHAERLNVPFASTLFETERERSSTGGCQRKIEAGGK